MSELLKSRHAFGSESKVDYAISEGLIDAYDILFLNEGKIGWIDKNGNKVILEDKEQVLTVDELPEAGESNVIYIYDSKFYFWNGTEYVATASGGNLDEEIVDAKVNSAFASAIEESNAYTDEQIANAMSTEVVEF
jgi:hypothetical protein